MKKIKYIGKRETYVEGMYGSKIEFTKGESVDVDNKLAAKLLRHKDQYIEDTESAGSADDIEDTNSADDIEDTNSDDDTESTDSDDDPMQDVRDSIVTMDKQSLIDFAEANFSGLSLNKRKSEENLRVELIQLVDRYGVS